MNRFWDTFWETLGRGGVIILSCIAINRTLWYQSFDGFIPLTNGWGWMISIAVVMSMFWLILPLLRFMKEVSKK